MTMPTLDEALAPRQQPPEPPVGPHIRTEGPVARDDGSDSSAGGNGQFSGVHDVLKSVDYWFEREVYQIEREAEGYAAAWAHENLPALTEGGTEPLPPEQVLLKRCGELWQRWPERVKVKMQDAIDEAAAELSSCVSTARTAIVEMQLARVKLDEAGERIEEIRQDMAKVQGPVRYTRFMGVWTTIALSVILVLVEFIANQPVFRIIWPMQQDVASSLSDVIADAAVGGWSSGLRVAGMEAVSYFEASLLALAVVLLLFILAKSLGSSLRPLLALRPKDYPLASRSIESLHRQKMVLGTASAIGTLAVLVFLFQSRGSASELVERRLDVANRRLERIQAKNDSLSASGRILSGAELQEVAFELATVERLRNDLGFAETIQANNTSILVLNISLVCFALVVGFMSAERDISETLGEHPDLPRLKEKCERLKESLIALGADARAQVLIADRAAARLRSLVRSNPLGTLDAKRSRLDSVVPRWRAENARIRGIDPVHIAAFRKPLELRLPDIERIVALITPDSFARLTEELELLKAELYSVEHRAGSPLVPQA